jgi:hypothetical protein
MIIMKPEWRQTRLKLSHRAMSVKRKWNSRAFGGLMIMRRDNFPNCGAYGPLLKARLRAVSLSGRRFFLKLINA